MAINVIDKIEPKNEAFVTILDANRIANGSVSNTVFQYLVGVNSAIQTQIDALGGAGSTIYQTKWMANGPYQVGSEVDGAYISSSAFTINGIYLWRGIAGATGSTVLDIHKNGTTLYTTQVNRPTIQYNDADRKVQSTLPDVTSVTIGDTITLDIDNIETGNPKDLMIVMQGGA